MLLVGKHLLISPLLSISHLLQLLLIKVFDEFGCCLFLLLLGFSIVRLNLQTFISREVSMLKLHGIELHSNIIHAVRICLVILFALSIGNTIERFFTLLPCFFLGELILSCTAIATSPIISCRWVWSGHGSSGRSEGNLGRR